MILVLCCVFSLALAYWGAVLRHPLRRRRAGRPPSSGRRVMGWIVILFACWTSPLWQVPVGKLIAERAWGRLEPLEGSTVSAFEADTGVRFRPVGGWRPGADGVYRGPRYAQLGRSWIAPLSPRCVEVLSMDGETIIAVRLD